MVDPLSIAIPAIGDQVGAEASAGSIRDRPRRTKVDLSVHRGRHQVFERVVSASLSSSVPGIPSQRRVSGEGTSRMGPAQAALEVEGKSTLAFFYDKEVLILEDPKRLASIWRKLRLRNFELPPLDEMVERDTYVRVAVANARVSGFASCLWFL